MRVSTVMCIAAASCAATVLAQPFFSIDDAAFGPESVLLDAGTGLEFLDLSLTDGLGTVQVGAGFGPGGAYESWRFATLDEVLALVNAVSGTQLSAAMPSVMASPTDVQNAIDTFGETDAFASTSISAGVLAELDPGLNGQPPSGLPVRAGWRVEDLMPEPTGSAFLEIATDPDPGAGVWLVRNSQAGRPTYQGRLLDDGVPVTGPVDLLFRLVDPNGNVIAGPDEVRDIPVSDGLFTAMLPFPLAVLGTAETKLRIAVRSPAGSPAPFVQLDPDQPLTPAARAIAASTAVRAATADRAVVADRALTADSAVFADTAGTALTFTNTITTAIPLTDPWEAFGSGFAPPRATRQGTLVTLSGVVREPTGLNQVLTIGVLPDFVRPLERHVYNVRGSTGPRRLDVLPSGAIQLVNDQGNPVAAWISLGGISFPLE